MLHRLIQPSGEVHAPPLLLGVVHLPALPGSPGYRGDMAGLVDAAVRDAEALIAGGMGGFIVENFGDAPFFAERVPPETIASMGRVLAALPQGEHLVGVNVLRNDARAALGLAAAFGLDFIRVNVHVGAAVTDQGVIEGRAAETVRARQALGAKVAILADVDVKHAAPLGPRRPLGALAEEAVGRGHADGLIVSGSGTGAPTALADLRAVKAACPEVLLLIGSGLTLESAPEALSVADGAIVGTALKVGGALSAPVDLARVQALVAAVRS
jgi:membrane complex biogenesis BtpA family protein